MSTTRPVRPKPTRTPPQAPAEPVIKPRAKGVRQPDPRAYRVTQPDDVERFTQGTEYVLEVPTLPYSSNPSLSVCQLSTVQAWAVRDALAKAMHPSGGRSLLERAWEEQDAAYDRLVGDPDDESAKGECRMGARLIAMWASMSYPAVQIMTKERWEARQVAHLD
jgi:hypothetical protein